MTERAFNRQLAINIRAAREAAGLRQCELADAIGCYRSVMCRIEQGTHRVGINRLRWLAAALGVDQVALLPRV